MGLSPTKGDEDAPWRGLLVQCHLVLERSRKYSIPKVSARVPRRHARVRALRRGANTRVCRVDSLVDAWLDET
jgi:hypothetical protein